MNTKYNTSESEDSELIDDKKQSADEWFDNLDNNTTEHEPEEHLIKYIVLKESKLQLC